MEKENSTLIKTRVSEHHIAVDDGDQKCNQKYTGTRVAYERATRDRWLLHHVAETQPILCYVFNLHPSVGGGGLAA